MQKGDKCGKRKKGVETSREKRKTFFINKGKIIIKNK